PDAELVYAARSGLKEPMAELLRRHWDTAVLLAERVLGSPDLARDAVQEAAIAAMTDVERLRSPDRFGAWFCGIALNVSRKWLRQLRSERSGLLPEPPSEAADPAQAAEIADTAARVRRAIAALADGQQDAVRLFYLQGLSHREVADELGISVGAVKARLHQARAALAPRLAQFTTTPEILIQEEETAVTATDAAEWAEVTVTDIRRSQDEDHSKREHVMVLTERAGGRWLPIWIGPVEATALALTLESVETPRPFPYKLAAGLVEAAGSQITEVRITQLLSSIFYAIVVVQGPAGPREVDARPSDAVNLAVVTGVPIQVNAELFAASARDPDADARRVSFPSATADIAAETVRRLAEQHAKRLGTPPADSGTADE
ncbi:MAG: bifunctional nuclease domain-containing protein, partial [Trebonia sp.]|uniref:bifunctional nuclease domain-containing protein n=1 Tax=Trebonia sp. TaxID=2767075 RepID=UPI003BB1E40F